MAEKINNLIPLDDPVFPLPLAGHDSVDFFGT